MTTEKRSKLDYYAGKAAARKKACGELDEALANLAALKQRASAAARRLEETERAAQEELDARVAEIEREHQEAMRRARALATERVHAARSEHGNAAALLAKAQRAAEEARARLLRLVPSGEELRREIERDDEGHTYSAALCIACHPHPEDGGPCELRVTAQEASPAA